MKPIGGHGEPVEKRALTAEEALRYAMSLPVTTTISGVDRIEILHQNLKIAHGFQPMSQQEMQALRDRCRQFAADGMQQAEVKEMMKAAVNTGHPWPQTQ